MKEIVVKAADLQKKLKKKKKRVVGGKYQELLKKRDEMMQDPNSVLYCLRSNYYRNNYSALNGVDDEYYKLRSFPLF